MGVFVAFVISVTIAMIDYESNSQTLTLLLPLFVQFQFVLQVVYTVVFICKSSCCFFVCIYACDCLLDYYVHLV